MKNIKEYKKISLDFRRVASNLLKTDYTMGNIPLIRFKKYIDENIIINEIINDKISDVKYDYNQFIKNNSGWNYIDVPILEEEHIKAMYDYMSHIVENNVSIESISFKFPCDSNKRNDSIQNFIEQAFKPLIDFINDSLSGEIVMLEEENMKIDMSHNQGVVNMANNNSTIESNNIINQNDISEITKIISSIFDNLNKIDISDEEKDSIRDDIEVINEQLENSIEKPARLKKAFINVKNFLTNAALLTGAGVSLAGNINQLISIVQPIIDKI